MSELTEQQRALARVCLGAQLDEASLSALGGDPRRWQVYRDLVRGRLWAAVIEGLPRTLSAAGVERFGGWFTGFLEGAAPRTRYVREVTPAFARWVRATEGDALSSPSPWLPEALSLDLAEHHVGLSDARLDPLASPTSPWTSPPRSTPRTDGCAFAGISSTARWSSAPARCSFTGTRRDTPWRPWSSPRWRRTCSTPSTTG